MSLWLPPGSMKAPDLDAAPDRPTSGAQILFDAASDDDAWKDDC